MSKIVIVGGGQINDSSEPLCLPIQNVLIIKSLGLLSVIFFSRWKGVTASVEVSYSCRLRSDMRSKTQINDLTLGLSWAQSTEL